MVTLEKKWRIYLFVLLSLLLFVSLAAIYFYYHTNRQKIANEILQHQNASLQKGLQVYKQNLEHIVKDWAIWDDSYDFAEGMNKKAYIGSNFGGDKTLLNLDIDGMLFLDAQGKMIYGRVVQNEKEKEISSPSKFITPYLKMLQNAKGTVIIDYVKSGKILFLSSLPIQKNDAKGKSNGLLIIYNIVSSNDFKTKDIVDVAIVEGRKHVQNSYRIENYETLLLSNCFQGENSCFCIQSKVIAPALKTFYNSTLYAIFLVLLLSLLAVMLIYLFISPAIKKIKILSKNVQEMLSDGRVKKLPDFKTEEFYNLTNAIENIVEKLHNGEQMLKFVLDNVPIGIFIYQPNIIYANIYALQAFGIDAKMLYSFTPDMLLDSSVPEVLRKEIQKIQEARIGNKVLGAKNYELRLNINGKVLDVIAVSQTVMYNKKPAGVVGFIDITETRKTKEEFSQILHYLPLVAYKVQIFKDKSFKINVSDAIEKLTGFSKKDVELNSLWWLEQIYEKDKQKVLDAQNQLLENGHLEQQYRLKCKDGSYIWIYDRPVNLNKGDKLVDILGFWNDITALKLHETSSKVIAEINQHFLTQNDEEKILFCICKHIVESEFCEQAVLSDSLGKVYRYPKEKIEKFSMQKEIELVHEKNYLKLDLYFQVKLSEKELLEDILKIIKTNIQTGLKVLANDKKLHHLTYHSLVCGCPNGNALHSHLKNRKEPFALAIMNIRSFSSINLLYGFEFGNRVLNTIAVAIKNSLRDMDILYHLEGDKFCAFIDIKDMNSLNSITKKISDACAKNIYVEQRHIPVSCRFGIAKYPNDSNNALEIKDLAITALSYANKYKKSVIFYEESMKNILSSYVKMERILIDAIEHKRFEFYYQPVIDTKTEKTVACEALIRLKDEQNNPISPEFMIQVAEELGLIGKITKIVVESVAKQQQIWQQKGLYTKVAINLSSYDVEDEKFIEFFEEILLKYGLTNKSIAVEITERTAVQNYTAARKFLNRMKDIGISVEIDDFGVAHSSLTQITQLEFDTLKIDKSFVDKILISKKDEEIVKVIIEMAKVLGVETLAEGVETKEQYKWLKELGCCYIQGYYFSKPLCVKDFEEYFNKQK